MLDAFSIPNPLGMAATIEGKWTRSCPWDWNGNVSASEPIVAVTFMRVGSLVEWARSEKSSKTSLEVRLLLGHHDSTGKDVEVSFSFGENGPRMRTMLSNSSSPPQPAKRFTISLGSVFSFCESFGEPKVELFGLVLLREQVTGARNGLWHLKPRYCDELPATFAQILSYGRAGSFQAG